MTAAVHGFDMFFQPVALTIMLVYMFGIVQRTSERMMIRKIVMGMVFGLAAVLSMSLAIQPTDGFIFDLRNLFIGLAMAFFGWITGLVALTMGIAMRLSIGGAGAYYGIAAMTVSAIAGLAWRHGLKDQAKKNSRNLILLGVVISLHMVVGLALPDGLRTRYFAEIAPAVFLMNLVGAYLLGRMLQREESILDRAAQLEHAACIDPLTELINRRTLTDQVERLPREQHVEKGRAVIYLDIDHFKEINDTFGHSTGDYVLRETVERIRRCLRPEDIFSRLGGDEFVVVLPQLSETTAKKVADRCCDAVANARFEHEGQLIGVTVSMGVVWSDQTMDFEAQLMSADTELYLSKSAGRNRVSFKSAILAA